MYEYVFFLNVGSSLSRVSSSSPSSTTPTEPECGAPHSYNNISSTHATSSELEDDMPPPPVANRPERTKSIVRCQTYYYTVKGDNNNEIIIYFSTPNR